MNWPRSLLIGLILSGLVAFCLPRLIQWFLCRHGHKWIGLRSPTKTLYLCERCMKQQYELPDEYRFANATLVHGPADGQRPAATNKESEATKP